MTLTLVHHGVALNEQQMKVAETVTFDGIRDGWSTRKLEARLDEALLTAGCPVPIPEKPVKPAKSRKLAPADTKAGIAKRHADAMSKALNERQRFKRGLELVLGQQGYSEATITRIVDEVAIANFTDVGGPDYTKEQEERA